MKRAIFIGRFQPLHIGHLSVLKEMEKNKDIKEIVIVIGSAQHKYTIKNPFTAKQREKMIKSLNLKKPVHIIKLKDINNDLAWVSNLEKSCPKFDIVYTGNSLVKKLLKKKYKIRNVKIIHKISSTKLRRLIKQNKNWKKYVPKEVRQNINY